MPKIIEDLKQKLLFETRRQIDENGYGSLTVRSVAKAAGVGVGTVYNYFASKDMLIAHLVLADWQIMLDSLRKNNEGKNLKESLRCIYDCLVEFTKKYHALFSDSDAKKAYSTAFTDRHRLLRRQLAELIMPLCEGKNADTGFYAEFVIEALLAWSLEGKSFDNIVSALNM